MNPTNLCVTKCLRDVVCLFDRNDQSSDTMLANHQSENITINGNAEDLCFSKEIL